MSKSKYKFNPETLKFDKVRTSVKKTAVKSFTFFTATLAVTVLYYLIFAYFFSTPKERVLMREILQMTENYASLTSSLLQIEDVLADIQQRDSNIYRSIFESEPVQLTALRAGFGGVNRRELLEVVSNNDLMSENISRTDAMLRHLRAQSVKMNDLIEAVREKSDRLLYYPSIQPIENSDLTHTAAGFGMRMHPIYRTQRFHGGIDFATPVGTPVVATANGTIVEAIRTSAQGGKVVIDHGNGYKTGYSGLEGYIVVTGQKVNRGEIIGTTGNPAMSTAPHLHYEVHKNGNPVDPVSYFFAELSPAAFARIKDLSNLGRTFD